MIDDALPAARRVLATRDATWARSLARRLGKAGARPNAVSIAGVAFAFGGCVLLILAPTFGTGPRAAALVLAAAAVQLRLLCNLLDGMLAVEGGFQTPTGAIYNDLPDRIADILLLAGAGYALRHVPYGPALGWLAAMTAVFTAYVRLLGGSLGVTQHFIGPMAKQHRMFTLTVALLLSAVETLAGAEPRALAAGLVLIAAGSIATSARRTRRIVGELCEGR